MASAIKFSIIRDWTYQTIQSGSGFLSAGGDLAIVPALWSGILDLRRLLVSRETRGQGCIQLGCHLDGNTLRRIKCLEGVAVLGWAQESQ